MSHSVHVHTIRLPLRKICSALPSVALISGAIMLPASAAPSAQSHVGLASSSSPTVVVPSTALTLPDSSPNLADRSPRHSPNTPTSQPLASMLSAGTVPGSSSLVTLDDAGIPVRALESYRKATSLVGAADPACHIDWALLAAIGRVESDHARVGGNQLDSAGVAQPGIIGVALDGTNGTARITDTDHGLLDRDTTYDRAVGPMQFIPSTWRVVGVDADNAPRAGDELHRAHGPVVGGVPVEQAMVGVGNPGGPVRTVQRDTDDAWLGDPGRVELVAAKAGMVALDPPDGGQQRPVNVASRVGCTDQRGTPTVGLEGTTRDAHTVQGNRGRAAGHRARRQHQSGRALCACTSRDGGHGQCGAGHDERRRSFRGGGTLEVLCG